MNKFYNIKYPEFIEKYGSDWTAFKTNINSWIDDSISKIFKIRREENINTASNRAIELKLRTRGIAIDPLDSLLDKKIKLRQFVRKYQDKGLQATYLDPIEEIVGIRGVIYSGRKIKTWKWNTSKWQKQSSTSANDIMWSISAPSFTIYIDVKTTNATLLDQIERLIRNELLPAYYEIYLIDSSFNVLRVI